MTLDLWCLVLVGTFALTGMFQGASGQVARLLALGGATAAGFLVGPHLGGSFLKGFPPSVRETLGGLAVGVVTYLILSGVLRSVFRRVVDRNAWRGSDRSLGAIFGGLQGLYLAWVLVSILPVVNLAFASSGSRVRFSEDGSRVAQLVAHYPFGFAPKKHADASALKKTIDRFQMLKMPAN
jgi:uncharacterized membrane protein required for colicin V production